MNLSIKLTSSWGALSDKQFKKICSVINTTSPSDLQLFKVFFTLLEINWLNIKEVRKMFLFLKLVPLSEIKKHFNFIYNNDHVIKFLKRIRIGFRFYYGPKTALRNLTIEEFAVTEDAFFMYYKTKNIDYLRVIAAVLYRRKRKGSRIPFDKLKLDEYLKPFKKLSAKKLLIIGMSYKGSSLYIQSKYNYVFKKAKASQKKVDKLKKPSLFKVVIDMAGGKFGSLNETKTTNIHDFLTELNNLLKPKQI